LSDVIIAISILWIFVFMYAMLGSIDFGAGFWGMLYGLNEQTGAANVANRFLSPSWKVTNVFLVLLAVALIGFFPHAAYLLGGILVLPVCLALILLIIRSTFMVYSYSVQRYSRALIVVSGLTGLLIPGLLISVLPVTLGGFVTLEQGRPVLELARLFSSPTEYAHLAFGLSTELFLSALFLADYARESEDESTYRTYRQLAVMFGPATLAMAILTTVAMAPEAAWIVRGFREQWAWFALSAAAFVLGWGALWLRRPDGRIGYPRFAVIAVVVQYALASYAYGRAHLPYLVYPHLTIQQGVTNHAMLRQQLIGYAVSTAILAPVFVWFWRLFFKDKRYLKPH
jgi:cytochrome d ubiquinol oxidase subunit II